MGLDTNAVQFLVSAHTMGVRFGRTVMLGRQSLSVVPGTVSAMLAQAGLASMKFQEAVKTCDYSEPIFEALGATQVDAHRGTRFSLAELALQAAIDGAGVVLGRMVLAEADLASGRLVRPFKAVLPLDVSYFLVMEKTGVKRKEIQCFRDWFFGRLQQSRFSRSSGKAS